jgi:hypothetical protein
MGKVSLTLGGLRWCEIHTCRCAEFTLDAIVVHTIVDAGAID